MNEEKTETILVRCTKSLKDEVAKAARRENRSMTNYVETVLIKEMMNNSQGASGPDNKSEQEQKTESILSRMKHNY